MNRRELVGGIAALAAGVKLSGEPFVTTTRQRVPGSCQIAAYYFGNYHRDPRNIGLMGPAGRSGTSSRLPCPALRDIASRALHCGAIEMSLTRLSLNRRLPRRPRVTSTRSSFDWYWYKDGPFLEDALSSGYLKAANCRDLQFAVMWANHDWFDIHPAKLAGAPTLQFAGGLGPEPFHAMTDRLLELFQHPSYLRVDGCPYFSIYELYRFIEGFGGVTEAAAALNGFRAKARALGFPGIHLNAVTWGVKLLPGQSDVENLPELLERLQIDSTTSYVWIHHSQLAKSFTTEYRDVQTQYEAYRALAAANLGRAYLPNVTVGWDSSPRACQTDNYRVGGYPFTSVVINNRPEAFRHALESARDFALKHLPADRRIITLNSWNEWTEGSYLEPDTEHGMAYLNAVRDVFA